MRNAVMRLFGCWHLSFRWKTQFSPCTLPHADFCSSMWDLLFLDD
jgi:hypothetical protein